jgi:hypothetical protein
MGPLIRMPISPMPVMPKFKVMLPEMIASPVVSEVPPKVTSEVAMSELLDPVVIRVVVADFFMVVPISLAMCETYRWDLEQRN